MSKSKVIRAGQYIRLYNDVIDSPAYRDLTVGARALLIEFAKSRFAANNKIGMSVSQAAKRLGCHQNTAGQFIHELEEHGFISLLEGADYVNGKARVFRVTFEMSLSGNGPTDEWKQWKPGEPLVTRRRK